MTLHGGSSSAIISHVFIQRSDTGPRERSWTSFWEWRPPRKLTGNSLSGKRGAAHRARRPAGSAQDEGTNLGVVPVRDRSVRSRVAVFQGVAMCHTAKSALGHSAGHHVYVTSSS